MATFYGGDDGNNSDVLQEPLNLWLTSKGTHCLPRPPLEPARKHGFPLGDGLDVNVDFSSWVEEEPCTPPARMGADYASHSPQTPKKVLLYSPGGGATLANSSHVVPYDDDQTISIASTPPRAAWGGNHSSSTTPIRSAGDEAEHSTSQTLVDMGNQYPTNATRPPSNSEDQDTTGRPTGSLYFDETLVLYGYFDHLITGAYPTAALDEVTENKNQGIADWQLVQYEDVNGNSHEDAEGGNLDTEHSLGDDISYEALLGTAISEDYLQMTEELGENLEFDSMDIDGYGEQQQSDSSGHEIADKNHTESHTQSSSFDSLPTGNDIFSQQESNARIAQASMAQDALNYDTPRSWPLSISDPGSVGEAQTSQRVAMMPDESSARNAEKGGMEEIEALERPECETLHEDQATEQEESEAARCLAAALVIFGQSIMGTDNSCQDDMLEVPELDTSNWDDFSHLMSEKELEVLMEDFDMDKQNDTEIRGHNSNKSSKRPIIQDLVAANASGDECQQGHDSIAQYDANFVEDLETTPKPKISLTGLDSSATSATSYKTAEEGPVDMDIDSDTDSNEVVFIKTNPVNLSANLERQASPLAGTKAISKGNKAKKVSAGTQSRKGKLGGQTLGSPIVGSNRNFAGDPPKPRALQPSPVIGYQVSYHQGYNRDLASSSGSPVAVQSARMAPQFEQPSQYHQNFSDRSVGCGPPVNAPQPFGPPSTHLAGGQSLANNPSPPPFGQSTGTLSAQQPFGVQPTLRGPQPYCSGCANRGEPMGFSQSFPQVSHSHFPQPNHMQQHGQMSFTDVSMHQGQSPHRGISTMHRQTSVSDAPMQCGHGFVTNAQTQGDHMVRANVSMQYGQMGVARMPMQHGQMHAFGMPMQHSQPHNNHFQMQHSQAPGMNVQMQHGQMPATNMPSQQYGQASGNHIQMQKTQRSYSNMPIQQDQMFYNNLHHSQASVANAPMHQRQKSTGSCNLASPTTPETRSCGLPDNSASLPRAQEDQDESPSADRVKRMTQSTTGDPSRTSPKNLLAQQEPAKPPQSGRRKRFDSRPVALNLPPLASKPGAREKAVVSFRGYKECAKALKVIQDAAKSTDGAQDITITHDAAEKPKTIIVSAPAGKAIRGWVMKLLPNANVGVSMT